MTTLQTADLPHDAVAPLAGLGAQLAAHPALDVTLLADTGAGAMLLVEGIDLSGAEANWLVTTTRDHTLTLEAVEDEIRLQLLAVAPPERILALITALAGRVKVDA